MREGNESPLINIAHIGWGDYGEPTVSQRAVTLIGVGIFLVANCNSHLPLYSAEGHSLPNPRPRP